MLEDPKLARLRQLFADELSDHVTRLETVLVTASRIDDGGPDVSSDALEGLAREVRRSAHTLKGSARVTGYLGIERLCEALESWLALPLAMSSPRQPIAQLRIVLPALREAAERLTRGGAPDDLALRQAAQQVMAPGARSFERAEASSDALAIPMPPRSLPPNEQPATTLAPGGEAETVRIPVASIADLLASAQELQALTGRMRGLRRGALETSLTDASTRIERALRAARAAVQASGDERGAPLVIAIEGAADALRASISSARSLEIDHQRAWAEARNASAQIFERSRRLRVRRFGSLSGAIEATAHDAAASIGKRISVQIDGEAAEVDRRVLEALREPLLHLVRNAVDHGLETPDERVAASKPTIGSLAIEASLSGVELTVVVRDDGRGVDIQRVRARAAELELDPGATEQATLANLFEPGFTTRSVPTALSGRGVGLDVVRQRIAQLHGRVGIETRTGVGTAFRIVVPSDLSILRGLVLRVRDTHVVVPTTAVERVLRVAERELVVLDGRQHVATDRGPVPVADLAEVLGFPSRGESGLDAARHAIVVLAIAERRIAIRADTVVDERSVVVQPLGRRIRRLALVSGGVVLEDGELALLLDVADVLRLARPTLDAPAKARPRARRILLVDDSVTTRQLERSLLEAAGYIVSVAADGLDAWTRLSEDEAFDAVVTDLEMPRLSGFALLARIRSTPRWSRMPVLLVTALASDDDRQRALELGASAYITKRDFDDEALLDALESLT